jgi:hypothetical protein
VSLVASTGPSRGRSQRSLLVSVGTTFRIDSTDIFISYALNLLLLARNEFIRMHYFQWFKFGCLLSN